MSWVGKIFGTGIGELADGGHVIVDEQDGDLSFEFETEKVT